MFTYVGKLRTNWYSISASALLLVISAYPMTLIVTGEVILCPGVNESNDSDGDSRASNKSGQLSLTNDTVQCTLEITNQNKSWVGYECLDDETVRVIGDYQVLRIRCSASFPLDLEYDGFQPTEAIQVFFSKEIAPNSSRRLIAYKFEVHVRSVAALYSLYEGSGNDKEKSAGAGDRPRLKHITSRTGRYTIHDVFNKTRQKSVYLFLEDEPDALSLMRNRFSTNVIPTGIGENDTTKTTMVVPCRPSHLHAKVSLFMQAGQQNKSGAVELKPDNRTVTYSPKHGFTLINFDGVSNSSKSEGDSATFFTCTLKDATEGEQNANRNEAAMLTLQFSFPRDDKAPQFGFEDLPTDSIQENINIHPQIVVIDAYNFQLSLDCIVDNPVDAVLTVIEARTPSHSRLVQEFVFPNYINGSYTGVIGTKSSPPGVLTTGRIAMAGLVFCMSRRITSNMTDYKVLEYATGFDRKVRFFKYGQDWSFFDVTESPAVNHLQILPGTLVSASDSAAGEGSYYINQMYTFKLRVRIHGLAPPVIWYQQLDNGTLIEEFIDYDLDANNFSHFNLTIRNTTKKIIAAASFWDRELWKNVSAPILPGRKEGQVPIVTNTNFDVQFIYGTSNQVLKCEAAGDPVPDLVWEKGSQVLERESGTNALILEFHTVNYSNSGDYVCTASSIVGSSSRTFSVQVVHEDHPNYFVSIGIPTIVFIIATVGTYLYFRFIRKENVGLTAKEIEAFEQGSPDFTKEMDYIVPENALHIPYNKSYEVEEKNFQVDTTEVLGSGQFGIVYKGIVNGRSVAVKTLKANADKDYLKALLSELKIMCYLGKHEHLVELVGANTSKLKKGSVFLFVEMCIEGSLEHHLRKNRPSFIPDSEYKNKPSYVTVPGLNSFNTQQLYIWSYQISKAMEYLVSKKVIHGDLATRNVLLSSNNQAKVTDFGLSRQLYNYELYVKKNQEPLPWRWMAVESLRDLIFSAHSDAWSFGVTLWEIFTLAEVPYPGLSWDIGFIQNLEHGLRMLKPRYGTQKFYEDILLPCWHTDPEGRPSFEYISQYILDLINIKPLPPHYIRHSDLLTDASVC